MKQSKIAEEKCDKHNLDLLILMLFIRSILIEGDWYEIMKMKTICCDAKMLVF